MKYIKWTLVILVLGNTRLIAQNNTSPYSIVGIGDIEQNPFDRSSGMGGAGVSLYSGTHMFTTNPASYGRLYDHLFTMDVTGSFKGVYYQGDPINNDNQRSADLQIGKLAVGVKIKKWWGASIGLMPFSNSSYSFSSAKPIVGSSTTIPAYYTGSGGLHHVYFANGFNLLKNLSIGIQAGYLFGSLQQEEDLSPDGTTGGIPINTIRDIYLTKPFFKAGLLYDVKLAPKWTVAVGASASNETKMDAEYSKTVYSGESRVLIPTETYRSAYFTLPVMFTVGGSLKYDDKLTMAFDFNQQNWDDTHFSGLGYTLVNSNKYSGGIEYSKRTPNKQYEKYYLQLGGYYSNGYLRIQNEQIKDYGVTLGFGGDAIKGSSGTLSYSLNASIGSLGTTQKGLVRENYIQAGLSLIYRDMWRTKMKRFN